MDIPTSLILALFLTLFIANMVMMARNVFMPGGKGWIIVLNIIGATAAAFGFIRNLAEALG